MHPLLTPEEVAGLLHLSLRTIYVNAPRLGGFYPAGIRALRFRRERIYAIMEGPQDRKVPVSVPVPGPAVQQNRVRHQKSSSQSHGRAPGGPGDGAERDSTIAADAMRFGLRDVLKPGSADGTVPSGGRKKSGAGHSEIP